jgi:hypothetical protein
MSSRRIFTGVLLACVLFACAAIAGSPRQKSLVLDPIAAYLQCPTLEERQALEKDFDISFRSEDGWNRIPYACQYAEKTPTRAKIYKVLGFLKDLNFSKPLPFTQGKSLYEFLTRAGRKLQIVPVTSCGGSSSGGNFTLMLSGNMTRWYPVLSGSATCAEVPLPSTNPNMIATGVYHPLYGASLIVHEGLHAITGKPHTAANGNDATIDEMGAWASQFYFQAWIALYSTNADIKLKDCARESAGMILFSRFASNRCPSDPTLREVVNTIRPGTCLDRSDVCAASCVQLGTRDTQRELP